jgi:hypothetical protein
MTFGQQDAMVKDRVADLKRHRAAHPGAGGRPTESPARVPHNVRIRIGLTLVAAGMRVLASGRSAWTPSGRTHLSTTRPVQSS